MKWMTRLFWLLLLVAIFLLALLTVNQQKVSLTFLDWTTPEQSVFWWLLIAFGVGLSIGLIAVMGNAMKGGLARRRLQKQINVKDKEIEQLRSLKLESADEPLAASSSSGDAPV